MTLSMQPAAAAHSSCRLCQHLVHRLSTITLRATWACCLQIATDNAPTLAVRLQPQDCRGKTCTLCLTWPLPQDRPMCSHIISSSRLTAQPSPRPALQPGNNK